jgi:hypothetical protein
MLARFALTGSLLAAALSGCGGDDAAANGGGAGMHADHDAGSLAFSDLYSDIFSKRCADMACHGGGGGGAGKLDMTSRDAAYASLVEVTAAGPECKTSGKKRVVKGAPDASLLYEKISGTPSCGQRMPIGSTLDADSIARIEAWIAAGAPND